MPEIRRHWKNLFSYKTKHPCHTCHTNKDQTISHHELIVYSFLSSVHTILLPLFIYSFLLHQGMWQFLPPPAPQRNKKSDVPAIPLDRPNKSIMPLAAIIGNTSNVASKERGKSPQGHASVSHRIPLMLPFFLEVLTWWPSPVCLSFVPSLTTSGISPVLDICNGHSPVKVLLSKVFPMRICIIKPSFHVDPASRTAK